MSFIFAVGRILQYLWPFISEIFFENKPFKKIVLENKTILVLLTLLFLSGALHWVSFATIHKLITNGLPETVAAKPVEKTKPKPPDKEFEEELNRTLDRLDEIYK